MFNKNKKAVEKQTRLEEYARQEEEFATDISATAEIKDPAQRILKLSSIEQSIQRRVSATYGKAEYAAEQRGKPIFTGTFLSSFGMMGGGLAILITHVLVPPVGICVLAASLPILLAGERTDHMVGKRVKKARIEEAEDYLDKMRGFLQQTAEMKESLIKNQAEQIAQSPFYEQVLRLPDLSEQFAGVAAKQITRLQEDLAAEKKAAQRGQSSAPVKKMGNYDKLKNPLGPR